MISKIVLTSLLAMFLSGGIYTKVTEDCTEDANVSIESVDEDVTKAIMYHGEVIPLIELPVVEITGTRIYDDLVEATIVGGEVYPIIELSEVVVTPGG